MSGVAGRKPGASAARSGDGICSNEASQQQRRGHGRKPSSTKHACAKNAEIRFTEVPFHLPISVRLQPAMITIRQIGRCAGCTIKLEFREGANAAGSATEASLKCKKYHAVE